MKAGPGRARARPKFDVCTSASVVSAMVKRTAGAWPIPMTWLRPWGKSPGNHKQECKSAGYVASYQSSTAAVVACSMNNGDEFTYHGLTTMYFL